LQIRCEETHRLLPPLGADCLVALRVSSAWLCALCAHWYGRLAGRVRHAWATSDAIYAILASPPKNPQLATPNFV
jgi:hypothetical protein